MGRVNTNHNEASNSRASSTAYCPRTLYIKASRQVRWRCTTRSVTLAFTVYLLQPQAEVMALLLDVTVGPGKWQLDLLDSNDAHALILQRLHLLKERSTYCPPRTRYTESVRRKRALYYRLQSREFVGSLTKSLRHVPRCTNGNRPLLLRSRLAAFYKLEAVAPATGSCPSADSETRRRILTLRLVEL